HRCAEARNGFGCGETTTAPIHLYVEFHASEPNDVALLRQSSPGHAHITQVQQTRLYGLVVDAVLTPLVESLHAAEAQLGPAADTSAQCVGCGRARGLPQAAV